MREVRIIDCDVVTLPALRCNGCGAMTNTLTRMGQIHDCPTRGAWQLVRDRTPDLCSHCGSDLGYCGGSLCRLPVTPTVTGGRDGR